MVKVKVQQGWLVGEQLNTVQGDGQYYSFKGIPYAEPPLGKLRFKAPRPPLLWSGERSATNHGPKCPQMCMFTQQIIKGNEDCLYLNVYTPNVKPATSLPVMVFIHGGGYKSGSGDDDYYGPDFLVAHGVVLVTINYRLEVLGFLCLDTEDVPGNAGMKDQVAALRWVKSNIASFGGNPENVTVFGESAGGASTALHVLSPMSKGLFKRAIPMSGVPLCNWCVSFQAQKRAFTLGKQLGLNTKDPNELLDFLQKLPVDKIIDTKPTMLSFEDHNNLIMFHFTPVTEKDFGQEHFMTESPLDVLKKGNLNDVDVFIGHTNEENLFGLSPVDEEITGFNKYQDLIVPLKLLYVCTPSEILTLSEKIFDYYFNGKTISLDTMREFISYKNCLNMIYDFHNFISKLSKVGEGRRFMYRFCSVSERNVNALPGLEFGIRGAAHMDDLMYLFNAKRYDMKLEKNTNEYKLVKFVCKIFTNFAKYGTPTPDSSLGVMWPEYDNTTKAYVNITDTLVPGTKPDAEELEFWNSIYASVNSEFQI